jgi:hypothetical protein
MVDRHSTRGGGGVGLYSRGSTCRGISSHLSSNQGPPSFPESSPLHNPDMANEALKSQIFFLTRGDILNKWCIPYTLEDK